VVYYYLYHYNM